MKALWSEAALMFHLFADDILSALRLVRREASVPGVIGTLTHGCSKVHRVSHRGAPPFGGGQLVLEASDIDELRATWRH